MNSVVVGSSFALECFFCHGLASADDTVMKWTGHSSI